nr:DNA polymerase III subunit gamma/tau [Chloroflexia bacterium]
MIVPSLFQTMPEDEALPEETASTRNESSAERGSALSHATRSLYRKYRPQSFQEHELVGQEAIVRTLRNAIRLDRVAHAYLFCGPRGTGKTTTARLLAKAVNCLDPDANQRPCNTCQSCLAITAGTATDIVEIDAASNRGIDDIRELRERVKYAPAQLRVKFYIVDEAHQITGAAANAFLKTLEEPPNHTKFILATTDPEELLSTIVSRCQRFDFHRITREAMIARLRFVADAESISINDDALMTIARYATGSLRDGLSLLDQLSLYQEASESSTAASALTGDDVRRMLGVSRNERVESLVQALADRDAHAALELVNTAIENGEDPRQLNRQLVSYLRLLLHERAGGSVDADETARRLAAQFALQDLANLARQFSETDATIKHATLGQLPLEIALVDGVLRADPSRSAPQPETRIERQTANRSNPATAEPSLASAKPSTPANEAPASTALRDRVRHTTARPQAEPAAVDPTPSRATTTPPPAALLVGDQSHPTETLPSTEASASFTLEQLVELWPRVRQDVKTINRRVEALLSSVDPGLIAGNQVTLVAAYEFHRDKLNTDDARAVVEEVMTRLVGDRVVIQCVLRGDLAPAKVTPAVGEPP